MMKTTQNALSGAILLLQILPACFVMHFTAVLAVALAENNVAAATIAQIKKTLALQKTKNQSNTKKVEQLQPENMMQTTLCVLTTMFFDLLNFVLIFIVLGSCIITYFALGISKVYMSLTNEFFNFCNQ